MKWSTCRIRRLAALTACALAGAATLACRAPETAVDAGVAVLRGGDMLAAHRDVVVRDSIEGDLMAAGGNVRFTGTVGGDVLAAGGTQVLGGTVAGSVRAAGGYVLVGTVADRNITAVGGTVAVDRRARIGGNAYLAGGTVRLEGRVDHLVRIMGGNVVLNGPIGGDVLVEAGRLELGPDAAIEGDLRYRLGRGQEATVHPNARVDGAVLTLPARRLGWVPWALRLYWVAAFLVAGAVIVAMFPVLMLAGDVRVRARPLASVGMGILLLLLVPAVLAAIAITVLGIPLALIGAALYAVSVYLAPVVVALWLGRILLSRSSTYPDRGELVGAFLLGGVIIGLLGLVPYAGAVILLLATIMGLGAMAVALWEGAVRAEARRA